MASSFSTNLGIEKPATGELSGSWGDVTNFNFDIFDRVTGAADLTASDLTTDLTIRAASPTSGQSNVQTGMFLSLIPICPCRRRASSTTSTPPPP